MNTGDLFMGIKHLRGGYTHEGKPQIVPILLLMDLQISIRSLKVHFN
jgi:hypothetical protein